MYYELNLQKLHQYRGILYKHVKEKEAVAGNTLNIYSVATRTEEFALVVEKENQVIRLNSKYNPKEEAKRWADQYQIKNLDSVIVMFGLGNGIFVREMISKMKDDNLLIIYEPSFELFLYIIRNYNMEDIIQDSRICLFIQDVNEFEFPSLLYQTLTWKNLFSKVECVHPGYDKLFEDSLKVFKKAIIDNTFNNLIAKNTQEEKGIQVVKNTLKNLVYIPDIITIWDIYDDLPKDVPAIIVAAGPSLEKNVDVLKKAKGKAIIFAVDRSYGILLDHDIEPDFIVTLDATKKLKNCGNKKGFEVPLLCEFNSSPAIMDNHNGVKIIFNCNEYIANIYEKFEKRFYKIGGGASVATAAFSICVNLGFKNIVFVGQDLAYLGDKTHAGGQKSNNNSSINLYVEDVYGNTVRTRHDWYAFLRSYENAISQLPDTNVIDATEGGAKIKGTRIMPLLEVINQYCTKEIDVKSIIESKEPTFNRDEIKEIYHYLVDGKNDLEKIKVLANQAIKALYTFEINKKLDGKKLTKKIAKISNTIEKMQIYPLIDQYVIGTSSNEIEELYFITNDRKTDEEIAFKNAGMIFKKIIDACDFILPLLTDTMNKLMY